jgi:hypothetical protein
MTSNNRSLWIVGSLFCLEHEGYCAGGVLKTIAGGKRQFNREAKSLTTCGGN